MSVLGQSVSDSCFIYFIEIDERVGEWGRWRRAGEQASRRK